jgi:hypothetical protein
MRSASRNIAALALAAFVSAVPAGAAPAAAAAPSKEIAAILDDIAAINRFSDCFTGTIKIASFEPGKAPAISSYRMYSKGMRKSLLVYLEPAKDRGKKVALNGSSLWLYFPRAGRSMLVRPMNTLTGSIAVGDIIGEPPLELYDFAGAEAGQEVGQRLAFTAKGPASPYGRMVYEYRGGRIASQEAYARSGILLKRVFFVEYELSEGRRFATKIKVQNAIYPDYYSLVQISGLKERGDIPDYYFTPEGLQDAGATLE